MEKSNGFITLNVAIKNWQWWDNPIMVSVWMHLLINANYEDKKWHGIDVLRGQCIIGQNKFADECGITRQQLRTALSRLEECDSINQQITNKYTIITICNYDSYQLTTKQEQPTINHQITNNQPSNNHQITTPKETNKLKHYSLTESNCAHIHTHTHEVINQRECYTRSILNDENFHSIWHNKTGIEKKKIKFYVRAFFFVLSKTPDKTWTGTDDFHMHFINWSKLQTDDKIIQINKDFEAENRKKKADIESFKRQEQERIKEQRDRERYQREREMIENGEMEDPAETVLQRVKSL